MSFFVKRLFDYSVSIDSFATPGSSWKATEQAAVDFILWQWNFFNRHFQWQFWTSHLKIRTRMRTWFCLVVIWQIFLVAIRRLNVIWRAIFSCCVLTEKLCWKLFKNSRKLHTRISKSVYNDLFWLLHKTGRWKFLMKIVKKRSVKTFHRQKKFSKLTLSEDIFCASHVVSLERQTHKFLHLLPT